MSDPAQADFWEQRYRGGTTPWERQGTNPAFLAWRADGTLSPCRILVPGAGRSPEPLALARDGFEVTVVDLAEPAVAVQRDRLAGTSARVVQANLLDWQPDKRFDAVYDQTCLCALPPSLWGDYAAQLARWTRAGGVLAVLFMQTGRLGGPPFHCDLSRMRELFMAPEWSWPSILPAPVPHDIGFVEQPAVLRRV